MNNNPLPFLLFKPVDPVDPDRGDAADAAQQQSGPPPLIVDDTSGGDTPMPLEGAADSPTPTPTPSTPAADGGGGEQGPVVAAVLQNEGVCVCVEGKGRSFFKNTFPPLLKKKVDHGGHDGQKRSAQSRRD